MIFQRPFKAFTILTLMFLAGDFCRGSEYSLADRNLLKIIEYEKRFFSLNSESSLDTKELSRNAQELVALLKLIWPKTQMTQMPLFFTESF